MAPSNRYEPDDRLNSDLARTTDDLIDRSKRLLAELDAELGRRRRPGSVGGGAATAADDDEEGRGQERRSA